MEYLHLNKIIHRDIRPENIDITASGYIKLKCTLTVKKNQGNRYFTMVGEPHYLSPEMIKGIGYTKNVDLWSLGICLYEMMLGKVPFGSEIDDP